MKELDKVMKSVGKKTVIKVGDINIGEDFTIIAGPCAVESEDQIIRTAQVAKGFGANILRGGVYKPRTSPYSFQGLGRSALKYLKTAKEITGLPVITELLDIRDLEYMCDYCDILQIGARNMYNYPLLKEVGRIDKPVLLKRGFGTTLEEFLNCAEYILLEGNEKVILCERGIRTFESYTRNTLDLSGIAALKNLSHLPVISDPSHATGRRELVYPMCLSSVMAGCDGLMIEIHIEPEKSLSDARQAISTEDFSQIVQDVKKTVMFRSGLAGY